jgi:hypothetical protein
MQYNGENRQGKKQMERTGRAENNEWIGYRSREKKKGTDSREQMKETGQSREQMEGTGQSKEQI